MRGIERSGRKRKSKVLRSSCRSAVILGVMLFFHIIVLAALPSHPHHSVVVQASPQSNSTVSNASNSEFIIPPENATGMTFHHHMKSTNDQEDEIRSIHITFLEVGEGTGNHSFSIAPGKLNSTADAMNLGFPGYVKYVKRYYSVDAAEDFPSFKANITIEFHLSFRSQLGTKTSEILENLRLLHREGGIDDDWVVLDIIGGEPFPVNKWTGMYRIAVEVEGFGDFAILLAQADLTIPNITLNADHAYAGQTLVITVTVRNSGTFPNRSVKLVRVKFFSIDGDGNQEYIGEIHPGVIEPDVDYTPDDDIPGAGYKSGSLNWKTSRSIHDDDIETFTIEAQVDPDGYVREVIETNNEHHVDLDVIGLWDRPEHPEAYETNENGSMISLIISIIIALCFLPLTHYLVWKLVK